MSFDDDAPKLTRYLKHVLTGDEVLDLRCQREEQDEEIERLQLEANTAAERAKGLKKRIEVLAAEGLEASKTIRTGYRYENIECVEEEGACTEDLAKLPEQVGKLGMLTRRLDTYEPIEWREFRLSERQGDLFPAEPPAPEPATDGAPVEAAVEAAVEGGPEVFDVGEGVTVAFAEGTTVEEAPKPKKKKRKASPPPPPAKKRRSAEARA